MLGSFLTTTAALLLSTAVATTAQSNNLDPNLHRSFYGFAYTPTGVILPDCGAIQTNVTKDIGLLAQLTPRIRLYAADCNQTAMVLEGIKQTNADMSVWLGIYIDGNNTVFERQLASITDAIKEYGTDHIAGITVGNEYLLNSYGSTGGGKATDPKGIEARTNLLENIKTTNETIIALNLDKKIPIGTADAGSAVSLELCAGTDYFMANVHAWFASVPSGEAADWVNKYFQETDVDVCKQASNDPTMYIAETGWPTSSDDTANEKNGANSPADIAGLQTFLDEFVCQANTNGTGYFFFEYHDEDWKAALYGGVEGHWGIFDDSYNLKPGLKMPNCVVESPTGGTVSQLTLDSSSSSSSGSSSNSSGSSGSSKTNANNNSAAFPCFSASASSAGALLVGVVMMLVMA